MAQLDILIPTYNRREFLPHAIDSLLAQTFQDFRIIIYDDGSNDGTENVISRDRRIVYIRKEINGGVGHARNALLELIDSPVACWQDSDDISHPLRIEKQMELLNSGGLDMVFTNLYFFNHPNHHTHTRTVRKIDVSKYDSYENIIDNTNFPTGMFLAHVKNICFNSVLRQGGEDIDWVVRLAERGIRFGQIEEPLYFLRRHPGRLTYLKREKMY